jgi:hypothetical protein
MDRIMVAFHAMDKLYRMWESAGMAVIFSFQVMKEAEKAVLPPSCGYSQAAKEKGVMFAAFSMKQ